MIYDEKSKSQNGEFLTKYKKYLILKRMICVSLRVTFVLKSTTLLLLCSYHVLKWELFILDSIILFLCFARSKFCSKISRFSMGIALTLARTARLCSTARFFPYTAPLIINYIYILLYYNKILYAHIH